MQTRFEREVKCSSTPEGKREWKSKLKEVEAKLYGGSVADAPAVVQPKSNGKPSAAPRPPTAEELVEHERYMAAHRKGAK